MAVISRWNLFVLGNFYSFGQGIDVQTDQLGTEMTLSDNLPTKLTVQSASQAITKFYTGRKHYFNRRAWKSNHCIWEVNLSCRNVKSWALILRMRIDALIKIIEFFQNTSTLNISLSEQLLKYMADSDLCESFWSASNLQYFFLTTWREEHGFEQTNRPKLYLPQW